VRNTDGPKPIGGDDAPARRSLAWDILSGAFLGALLGGALLGVGVFRALGAIVFGSHLAPLGPDDFRIAEYYVGSFTDRKSVV
jgi:hypothetical protein